MLRPSFVYGCNTPLAAQRRSGWRLAHCSRTPRRATSVSRNARSSSVEDEANVAHVLVLAAFAQVFELAQDHLFGRRDPGSAALQIDAAAMLERPGMQRIARTHEHDIDVGGEARFAVDARRDRSGDAVRQVEALERFDEIPSGRQGYGVRNRVLGGTEGQPADLESSLGRLDRTKATAEADKLYFP